MSHSKPLLIPWLRAQIDSGAERYPGVHWMNPEHTEFSIPWKHGLRQDSSNSDILIFKVIVIDATYPLYSWCSTQRLVFGVILPALTCFFPAGVGRDEWQWPGSGRPLSLEEELPQRPPSQRLQIGL